MLAFEWDGDKARRNFAKHGVSFDEARLVFTDPSRIEQIDNRDDYGEERVIAVGMAAQRLISVVYVLRGNRIRIISARRASKVEADDSFQT